jgi:hypothetical protein
MRTGSRQDDKVLIRQLTAGLSTSPQASGSALKAIVEEARRRAAHGDFSSIRHLADQADDAVEQVKREIGFQDERLAKLATLAQQTFAVLAIVGGSDGQRDSGYFRASLAHAERLDAMTDGALGLADLVNLIGQTEDESPA